MAVGAGKSGCVCGAFNGGLLALGMFFGRTEQDGPTNPKSIKCMELVHELHDWFKKANGKNAICCRVLTKEFNMGQGEHKEQCIYFTGLCAWKVAQIVCRELGIKNLDEIDELVMKNKFFWEGSATELVSMIKVEIQPHVITRKLNILSGRLYAEHGIYYKSNRTHDGRKIRFWKDDTETA